MNGVIIDKLAIGFTAVLLVLVPILIVHFARKDRRKEKKDGSEL